MLEMAKKLYRKPPSSPLPEVHVLFSAAAEKGLGTDHIADLTGYSRDAVNCLRRPDKHGGGSNPSFQFLKDVAQVLGYEFRLVPVKWRGQNESSD
jgi:protein tyrosine phosphatase (PTP) superfamily phosphohydrolase (DUF442 family)